MLLLLLLNLSCFLWNIILPNCVLKCVCCCCCCWIQVISYELLYQSTSVHVGFSYRKNNNNNPCENVKIRKYLAIQSFKIFSFSKFPSFCVLHSLFIVIVLICLFFFVWPGLFFFKRYDVRLIYYWPRLSERATQFSFVISSFSFSSA